MIDELEKYKMRNLKIKILEEEKDVFSQDIERGEEIDRKLKVLYYHKNKVDNALMLLKQNEREVIYKAYIDMKYTFKSFYSLAHDLNRSYTSIMALRKVALEKLENWENDDEIY